MANGERRSGKRGRRESDLTICACAVLQTDVGGEMEEISYEGAPLVAPASFGSDGDEHRLSNLAFMSGGGITAFSH